MKLVIRVQSFVLMLLACSLLTVSCDKFPIGRQRDGISFEMDGTTFYATYSGGAYSRYKYDIFTGFPEDNIFAMGCEHLTCDRPGTVARPAGSFMMTVKLNKGKFPRKKAQSIDYVHDGKNLIIDVELFKYSEYLNYVQETEPNPEELVPRAIVKKGRISFSEIDNLSIRKWDGTFDIELDVEYVDGDGVVQKTVPMHFSNGKFKRYYDR